MPFRPTDWTGTKNSFVEERILNANDPENRVIILEHRPFFEGVKVYRAGTTTPLTRGVDYELAYELPELEGVAFSKLFCGINFINPSVGGALRFEGTEVSGEFHTHFVEILDKLVKYVNTPPDLQWLNVDDRPALVPQEKSANSWYDYLNKKYLASAIRDVNISADDANAELSQKLDALKALVVDLQNEVTVFNYKAHIDNPMAHDPTCAQVGAHPANRDAPRALMAYGRTLLELTRDIRSQGLQQSDVDRYVAHYASGDVTGSFVQQLSPDRALFRSNDGNSEVIFTTNDFTIRSKGAVVLSASTDFDDTIRFIEWRSGSNKLRIESSGGLLGMDKIFLNDRVLLNTYSVLDYQATESGGSTDPDDNKLYIEGRNGITFTGKGSRTDPVVGSFKAVKATKTVAGAAKLKLGPGTEVDGFASTPASLTPYLGKVQEFVPKSTLLNGKPMDDGSRTIDRAALGLGLANNTADLDKQLSNPQSAALAGLSPKDHTHDWGGLTILPANHSMPGITKYTTSLDGAAPNKGIVPAILNELSSRVDALGIIFAEIDTSAATDFSIIDGSTWTVGSTKRSLTVKDLRYFYLVDNVRKEGRVSGTVDLETTPMFKWFSPSNRMERNWPESVKRTAQGFSWELIPADNRPTLPFRGEIIGHPDYTMGSLSVVTLLSKFNILPSYNRLVVYAVGGGKITLYVNGQEYLSTDKALFGVVSVTPKSPIVLGLRVDCNDAAVTAGLGYEVYDGVVPVACSYPTTKIAKLEEFVLSPLNLKHYIYLNMESGALFSRAEPIGSEVIDVRYSLVGVVDVPTDGLVSPVVFAKQLDFGTNVETVDHLNDLAAHSDMVTDYKIVDAVVAPLGKLDFTFDYTVLGSTNESMVWQTIPWTAGGLKFNRNGVPGAVKFPTEAIVAVRGQSPYFWLTPKNPKANNHPTFEGGLLLDAQWSNNSGLVTLSDFKLLFGSKKVGTAPGTISGIALPLNKTDPIIFRRHDGFGGSSAMAKHANLSSVPTTVKPTVIKEWTNIDLGMIGLPPKAYPGNRILVKYRFDIKTNTMRVFTARYVAGETSVRLLELEYKFNFDAFGFMGGYVGLGVPDDSNHLGNETIQMLPAPMLINDQSFDINKYAFYRSLFESYIDSKKDDFVGKVIGVTGDRVANWHDYTEVTSISKATGQPYVYDNRFPQALRPFEIPFPAISDTPVDTIKWCKPISMADGTTSKLGGTFDRVVALFETSGEYTAAKVVVKYTSYQAGTLTFDGKMPWTGDSLAITAQEQSATPTVTVTEKTISQAIGCGVCRMLLRFDTALVAGVYAPANCNYVIEVYDTENVLRETFTNAEPRPVYSYGARGDLYTCNPYHMTRKTWSEIKAIMAVERKASKETFGDW